MMMAPICLDLVFESTFDVVLWGENIFTIIACGLGGGLHCACLRIPGCVCNVPY